MNKYSIKLKKGSSILWFAASGQRLNKKIEAFKGLGFNVARIHKTCNALKTIRTGV